MVRLAVALCVNAPDVPVRVSAMVPVEACLLIVTVTIAWADPEPVRATCVGETVQLLPDGIPLQESDAVPLNPPSDVAVSVYVPEDPRTTVSELGDTATVKSEIDCVSVDEVLPEKFALLEAKTATT